MAIRYICNRRLRLGGKVHERGDAIDVKPWMKIGPAVKMGWIERFDDATDPLPAASKARAEIPDDPDTLLKAELVDLIEGLGFSTEDVRGTGSNGLVTKADLVQFLNDRK